MRYVDSLIVATTAIDNVIKDRQNFTAPNYTRGLCGIQPAKPWENGPKLLEYMLNVINHSFPKYKIYCLQYEHIICILLHLVYNCWMERPYHFFQGTFGLLNFSSKSTELFKPNPVHFKKKI